jgi:diacylglycerol O-acyltransferase
MRQLSGIDAAFLQMETTTTYAHVASVSVYAPAEGGQPLTLDGLRTLVAARIHRVPVLRQRLLELPLELGRPYWVDDPDFRLERHVREAELDGPVDEVRLAAHVSRAVGRRLDRAHPLWELQLVRGLPQGRFALLGIVHHAAVDGIAGRDVLATLLDREPDPEDDPPPPPWQPEPLPGAPARLARGLLGLVANPLRALELQQQAAEQAFARLRRALPSLPAPGTATSAGGAGPLGAGGSGAVPLVPGLLGVPVADVASLPVTALPAPRALFNRPITGRRAWLPTTLPADRVRAVRKAHGVSGNDVVLAVCAGALRGWLADHGGVPARPLRAMVPISVRARSGERGEPAGNRVSFMVADLPTHEPDARRRLERVAASTREARAGHDDLGVAAGLAGAADLVVPVLATAAVRAAHQLRLADWVEPAFNLVVSNVPGPQFPLYLRGARLLHAHPVSVVTDGLGLNITVQTTAGGLDVGITTCPEVVPDLPALAAALPAALAELEASSPT